MRSTLNITAIARVCHQANKAWCEVNADHSQPNWEQAPDWQKDSAVQGVEFHLANPDAGPEASHNNWLKQKVAEGWIYGEEKDPVKKTHFCMVPFDELPLVQQKKDKLFRAIIHALKD